MTKTKSAIAVFYSEQRSLPLENAVLDVNVWIGATGRVCGLVERLNNQNRLLTRKELGSLHN